MSWKNEIKKNEANLPPEVNEAIKEAVKTVMAGFNGLSDDRLYSLLGPSRSTKGDKNYATPTELVLEYMDKFRENLINANKMTWNGTME
jgi:hypothetical protein